MYPNLYYVFKDWFGVEWHSLRFINTFGLMVAISFLISAFFLSIELKRKERQGLLTPLEENIMVGKPVSIVQLLTNFLLGFLFGYKMLGLFLLKDDGVNPQEYIFSAEGTIVGGLLVGGLMAFMKWNEKRKQVLEKPESRVVRIWPHDRVGDIVVIALVGGILGAKLFDNFENWDDFVQHPLERLLSAGGLTFYGGLIVAALAIIVYAYTKKIKVVHLVDALTPVMMLAYALGRIGCQVSGDGDWGIYNSAYVNDPSGKMVVAAPGDFDKQLNKYCTYFLKGEVRDQATGMNMQVTDRTNLTLSEVPHFSIKAPSWLPDWLFAYNYPQNVNNDGILIPGVTDEHNRVLPSPVFPTPLYETLICFGLFLALWFARTKLTGFGAISGLYFMLNGAERFLVEKIRVNHHVDYYFFKASQAELISFGLIILGFSLLLWSRKTHKI